MAKTQKRGQVIRREAQQMEVSAASAVKGLAGAPARCR